ncbi:heme oxygenase [Suillus occidentalis]|nr:heme oxygenase [Suillus occidentalis]
MSSLLHVGTSEAHEDARHIKGGIRLVQGELNKEGILVLLDDAMAHIHRGIETHASYPTLQLTYNPTLLARTRSISQDISCLLAVPEAEWQAHPSHSSLMASPPKPFVEYTTRIRELSESSDPTRLLAHAYVRYLGDLSGGQIIRRRIANAYNLDVDRGDGIRLYHFKKLDSSETANIGDIKKIKEWYKDGMNTGIGDDTTLKAAVLEEALLAFKLSVGILDLLSGEGRAQEPPQPVVSAPRQAKALYDPILVSFGGLLSVAVTVGLAHVVYMGPSSVSSGNCVLRGVEYWLRSILSIA